MPLAAVFQIGSLGDAIVSIPTLLSLRELIPDCSEYLLVSRFDGHLKVTPSHVFEMAWRPRIELNYDGPGSKMRRLCSSAQVLAQLRYYRPRQCVYLMPTRRSPRQIDRDKLFFRAGGVPELHGFLPVTENETLRKDLSLLQTTESFLRFRRVWGTEADAKFPRYAALPLLTPGDSAHITVNAWLAANRLHPARPLIAVCPYANTSARTLPLSVICGVLNRLEVELGLEAVVLGGSTDSTNARDAIRESGAGLNACGAFSLEESAAFLKSCRMVVTAESGPMHLAGAVGVPSVAIFSQVNDRLNRWFPLSISSSLLFRNVKCAGCYLSTCDVPGHPCLGDIKASHIVAAVAGKMNGTQLCPQFLDGTRIVEWTPELRSHMWANSTA